MVNYKTDSSSIQVTDFAGQIWYLNQAIMESLVYNNTNSIPRLVEHLESLLTPYIDGKYEKEIEKINDETKPKAANTQAEQRYYKSIADEKRVTLIYRALMKLAYRNRFLPAASHSNADNVAPPSSDFIIGGGDESE